MKEFDELKEVSDTLLGEKGCPWDRQQTFESLQPYLLEECHEVIDAVDGGVPEELMEELGDLLYVIIFYCQIAEKEKKFTLQEVLSRAKNKLIHRHPHVFGEVKISTIEEVYTHWEKAKSQEKTIQKRKSALEGIPKTLPALARAQKLIHKMKKYKDLFLGFFKYAKEKQYDERVLGDTLIELIYHADEREIDLESALRRSLKKYEEAFQKWEETQS